MALKGFIAAYWQFVVGNRKRTGYVLIGVPLALLVLWLVDVHPVLFDPVPAVGIVTATQCAGKTPTFDYRFEVSGNVYVGRGHAKILPDSCSDTWNGAPVEVTYLRDYPSVSIGGSMSAWWGNLGWLTLFGCAVVGPFVLLLMFLRERVDG
jgi:hypothetical protein